jgi:hypothetical protein
MLVVRSSPLDDACGGRGLAGQVAGIRRRVEWKLPSCDKFG